MKWISVAQPRFHPVSYQCTVDDGLGLGLVITLHIAHADSTNHCCSSSSHIALTFIWQNKNYIFIKVAVRSCESTPRIYYPSIQLNRNIMMEAAHFLWSINKQEISTYLSVGKILERNSKASSFLFSPARIKSVFLLLSNPAEQKVSVVCTHTQMVSSLTGRFCPLLFIYSWIRFQFLFRVTADSKYSTVLQMSKIGVFF